MHIEGLVFEDNGKRDVEAVGSDDCCRASA